MLKFFFLSIIIDAVVMQIKSPVVINPVVLNKAKCMKQYVKIKAIFRRYNNNRCNIFLKRYAKGSYNCS